MKLVIGISGKATAGKTTTREIIEKLAARTATRCTPVSFADPIRYLAKELFGWDGEKTLRYTPDILYPVGGGEPVLPRPGDVSNIKIGPYQNIDYSFGRGLLIGIGMKMREIDPNVWVKYAIRRIKCGEPGIYVFDDVRFKNELEQLREAFGADFVSVRVTKEGTGGIVDPTENDLDGYDNFDLELTNNGSREDLTVAVATQLKGLADAVTKKQD